MMEDTEVVEALKQIRIGTEPDSGSSPKPSSFGLDSIEIFESIKEIRDLLKGRTKMAYIVSVYHNLPCEDFFLNLLLSHYIDRNLLDVYGFLGSYNAKYEGILYDPSEPETEVCVTGKDFNSHHAAITLIQGMLYNGSSIKDIKEKLSSI